MDYINGEERSMGKKIKHTQLQKDLRFLRCLNLDENNKTYLELDQVAERLGKPPKLYIYVEGGLIQTIMSDRKVDLMILDGDIDGCDETKQFKYFDGDTFEAYEAYRAEAEVDKEVVDHYFKQKRKRNVKKTNS